MTTARQDREFLERVVGLALLEEAAQWIGDNLTPDEVFSEKDLESWAVSHGWREEE